MHGVRGDCLSCAVQLLGERSSFWGLLIVVMWRSMSSVTMLWNERAGNSVVPTGQGALYLTFPLSTGKH